VTKAADVIRPLSLFLALVVVLAVRDAGATTWRAVPEESEIGFEVTQLGATVNGRFAAFQADIRFDPADLADSRAVVLVEIASVDTKNEDRDAQIRGPDWFDVATYPLARFETTSFRRDGDAFVASARLTLRDVTREVDLPFNLGIDDGRAVMTGELVVSRTDFGIGRGQWTDTAVVGDQVRIGIRLLANTD